jgi:hypothetical protein
MATKLAQTYQQLMFPSDEPSQFGEHQPPNLLPWVRLTKIYTYVNTHPPYFFGPEDSSSMNLQNFSNPVHIHTAQGSKKIISINNEPP